MAQNNWRFLSIQSHVVRGMVGSALARFSLQILKHHVDALYSVYYSSTFAHVGMRLNDEDVKPILDSLVQSQKQIKPPHENTKPATEQVGSVEMAENYLDHQCVITGYMCDESFYRAVCEFLKNQKQLGAPFFWICDPVLGDDNDFYTDPGMVQMYKNYFHLADLITPNQYELQWLSSNPDEPIKTLQDAILRVQGLHCTYKIQNIVVTSLLPEPNATTAQLICSQMDLSGSLNVSITEFEHMKIYVVGTGDLMSAMIGHALSVNKSVEQACLFGLSILQAILRKTIDDDKHAVELDLVSHYDILLNPPQPKFKTTSYVYKLNENKSGYDLIA